MLESNNRLFEDLYQKPFLCDVRLGLTNALLKMFFTKGKRIVCILLLPILVQFNLCKTQS